MHNLCDHEHNICMLLAILTKKTTIQNKKTNHCLGCFFLMCERDYCVKQTLGEKEREKKELRYNNKKKSGENI